MVTAEADYDGQTRSADTFVLPASAAGDIPAPSDDVLKAYFNDRKSSYRAPEYRAFDVVTLEPDTLANPAEVSDADAEAAYARFAGKDPKFGAPEKRDLEQILFPNQAEADAAAAKIKAGASFDDIVKARNLKPEDVELGLTAKDAIVDPSEADAVFALPAGGVSGVLHEPVRAGHRPGEEHRALHGEAVLRSRRRHQAPDLGRPGRRQDPGLARQDRGPARVRQAARPRRPRRRA